MRWIRAAIVVSLAMKLVVFGTWWQQSLALAEREEAAATDPLDARAAGVPRSLFEKSRGFRTLLEAVRDRGAELDRREEALGEREAAVKTLEQLLSTEVARLEALAPEGGEGAAETNAGPCGLAVTKVYQSMKPEEAGPILDLLDDRTVKAIFSCMKEKQVGAILAAMNRERAVALTKVLAGRAQATP